MELCASHSNSSYNGLYNKIAKFSEICWSIGVVVIPLLKINLYRCFGLFLTRFWNCVLEGLGSGSLRTQPPLAGVQWCIDIPQAPTPPTARTVFVCAESTNTSSFGRILSHNTNHCGRLVLVKRFHTFIFVAFDKLFLSGKPSELVGWEPHHWATTCKYFGSIVVTSIPSWSRETYACSVLLDALIGELMFFSASNLMSCSLVQLSMFSNWLIGPFRREQERSAPRLW